MTEQQPDDERQMREQARALWGRDDPADDAPDAAAEADEETPTRQTDGPRVPREGTQPTPPPVDDDRQFVRDLFN